MRLLKVLMTPSCWFQNNTYSEPLDVWINHQLDLGNHFSNITLHRATLSGLEFCVANHPYASFTHSGLRPSRSTIFRAHDQLLKDFLDQLNNEETPRT